MTYNKKWDEFINELYSTAGHLLDGEPRRVSAEAHYAGTKERADYQGLENYNENSKNPDSRKITIRINRHEPLNEEDCMDRKTFAGKQSCVEKERGISPDDSGGYVASILRNMGKLEEGMEEEGLQELIGVSDMQYLAQGNWGKVYSANHPERGQVAVKILTSNDAKGMGHIMREMENYQLVGEAVENSSEVAKHFPKVYDVRMKRTDEGALGYIVMELIKPSPYSQEIVNTMFSGLEYYLAQEDPGFEQPVPLSDEGALAGDEIAIDRKTEYIFLNDLDQIGNMITDLSKKVKKEIDISKVNQEEIAAIYDVEKFKAAIMSVFYNYFVNAQTISDDALERRSQMASDNVVSLFPNTARAMSNANRVADGDFGERPVAKLGVLAVIASIAEVMSKFPSHPDLEFEMIMMIEDAVKYPRKLQLVPITYINSTLRNSAEGRRDNLPEAVQSLEKAFVALKNQTGLIPKDLQSLNIMVKDETGELVVVDFGNFYT
jgi:hypothetical protein